MIRAILTARIRQVLGGLPRLWGQAASAPLMTFGSTILVRAA
jgi:hypothetical protein